MIISVASKNNSESAPIVVNITRTWRTRARNLATQQFDTATNKFVYFNDLAVSCVQNALGWMRISTSRLTTCYIGGKAINTDLLICSSSYLRCLAVMDNQTEIKIPADVDPRLLGTVVVKFGEKIDTATILGFVPARGISQEFDLTNIPSIDKLLNLV